MGSMIDMKRIIASVIVLMALPVLASAQMGHGGGGGGMGMRGLFGDSNTMGILYSPFFWAVLIIVTIALLYLIHMKTES